LNQIASLQSHTYLTEQPVAHKVNKIGVYAENRWQRMTGMAYDLNHW